MVCKQNSNKIALVHNEDKLTYAELDSLSEEFYRCLLTIPGFCGSTVALVLPRGIDAIVSILALLKAGCTYVPLDPELPDSRKAFIFKQANCSFFISFSVQKNTSKLKILTWNKISVSRLRDSIKSVIDAAYIMFTSGSTGIPKGVIIREQGILQLVIDTNYVHIQDTDVVSHVSDLAFDGSTFEIWGALLNGAKLVICSRDILLSFHRFKKFMMDEKITIMFITTSLFNQLADHSPDYFSSVNTLLIGGEVLSSAVAKKVLRCSNSKILNMYGPTENTTFSSYCNLREVNFDDNVPIGLPVSGTSIYVLDKDELSTDEGELYLGGAGIAAGYIGNSEENKKFVNIEGKGRLYRTGDIVRFRKDGLLEFIGRKDHQVKIRGHRVELDGICKIAKKIIAAKDALALPIRKNNRLSIDLFLETDSGKTFSEDASVDSWKKIYNQLYSGVDISDFREAIVGWRSSKDNKRINEEDMREWVADTINKIKLLNPRQVLEIGCGTGLLAKDLIKISQSYTGCDFSEEIINRLSQTYPNATFYHLEANNINKIKASFDTIIINSVVQYFPNMTYLSKVLELAENLLTSDGCIYVGDIRDFRLLELFHFSHLRRFTKTKALLLAKVTEEKELLISPSFFQNAFVSLKNGKYSNELIKYRYDVFLFKQKNKRHLKIFDNKPGNEGKFRKSDCLKTIVSALNDGYDIAKISGLKNKLLSKEWNRYSSFLGLENRKKEMAFTPTSICSFLRKKGIFAFAIPNKTNVEKFDIISSFKVDKLLAYRESFEKDKQCCNLPLIMKLSLESKVMEHLRNELPSYAVPNSVNIIPYFPLNLNGKRDIQTLQTYIGFKKNRKSKNNLHNCSECESFILAVMSKYLNRSVTLSDSFLSMGGDSLLAAHISLLIERKYKISTHFSSILQSKSFQDLSDFLEKQISEKRTIRGQKLKKRHLPRCTGRKESKISFAQKRILNQIQNGSVESSYYNVPFCLSFNKLPNLSCLQGALDLLCEKHPILKTKLNLKKNLQEIDASLRITIEKITDREKFINEEFDIQTAPLVRVGYHNDQLIVVMSHLITDEFSVYIFVEDFAKCFNEKYTNGVLEANNIGKANDNDKEKGTVSSLFEKNSHFLEDSVSERDLLFWREQLKNLPEPVTLGSGERSRRGEEFSFLIKNDVYMKIDGFTKSVQITPFSFFSGVLGIIIFKETQMSDIVIASSVSQRLYTNLWESIGYYANTILLRTIMDGQLDIKRHFQMVHENISRSIKHGSVPFEFLSDKFNFPKRCYRIKLILAKNRQNEFSFKDSLCKVSIINNGGCTYDLHINIKDMGNMYKISLYYDKGLYTMRRIKDIEALFRETINRVLYLQEQKIRIGDL